MKKHWEKPHIFPIHKHFLQRRYRRWVRALIIELDAQEGISEMQAVLLLGYKRVTGIKTFKELHAEVITWKQRGLS